MPSSFKVTSSVGDYAVLIESGALAKTLAEPGERVYIVDAIFEQLMLDAGIDPILIKADESAKSLDRMSELVVALRERRANRKTLLVAIGGGVVQDAAAFLASVYMRGLEWIYLPTTLLSMTDSCIGGKSSINVGAYKNIVGTIHPPQCVIVDPNFILSLTNEQKAAGLCEAVKICICKGAETLKGYLALEPTVDMPPSSMEDVIILSLQAKRWFIEIDEFDRAERLLLNFGHTFGHAFEAASCFDIDHGIAVGLGMLAALHLGRAMGHDYTASAGVGAFEDHVSDLISTRPGLASALMRLDIDSLIDAFEADKKHSRDDFAVILVAADGSVERRFLPRNAASKALIANAFQTVLSDWSKRSSEVT